jgi:disulfide oxidoreductase YuzD
MSAHRVSAWIWVLVAGLCLLGPSPAVAGGESRQIEATLVWATNEEMPADKKLKELEPELTKRFRHTPYKWKYYYIMNRKEISAAENVSSRLEMSEHCAIEIKIMSNERVEVKLIGEGKPVSRHVEYLPKDHPLVLAGDAQNDTAWLIVLRQSPTKK